VHIADVRAIFTYSCRRIHVYLFAFCILLCCIFISIPQGRGTVEIADARAIFTSRGLSVPEEAIAQAARGTSKVCVCVCFSVSSPSRSRARSIDLRMYLYLSHSPSLSLSASLSRACALSLHLFFNRYIIWNLPSHYRIHPLRLLARISLPPYLADRPNPTQRDSV
jgi:hypothetical protein